MGMSSARVSRTRSLLRNITPQGNACAQELTAQEQGATRLVRQWGTPNPGFSAFGRDHAIAIIACVPLMLITHIFLRVAAGAVSVARHSCHSPRLPTCVLTVRSLRSLPVQLSRRLYSECSVGNSASGKRHRVRQGGAGDQRQFKHLNSLDSLFVASCSLSLSLSLSLSRHEC